MVLEVTAGGGELDNNNWNWNEVYTVLHNMWSEVALPALPWPQGDVPPSALLFLSSFPLVPNLLFVPGVWDRNRFASIAQKHASLVRPPALQNYPARSQALVLWPRLGSPKWELFAHLSQHFILQACGCLRQSLAASPPNYILSLAPNCFWRSEP